MSRPPRDLKKDRLLSLGLFMYSYVMVGIAEMIAGFIAYILLFNYHGLELGDIAFTNQNGWNIGHNDNLLLHNGQIVDSDTQNLLLKQVNSVSFFAIVACQCECARVRM